MDGLEARVRRAGEDRAALDGLLREYLPFLKKQASQGGAGLDYDDRLSLSMLAFTTAVREYNESRGSFLGFAQTCIRNRLADAARQERRYNARVVPLEDAPEPVAPDSYALSAEREGLQAEIAALDSALADCGLCFRDLPSASPRQGRARVQCLQLASSVAEDTQLRADFRRTGRLPQGELARRAGISVKTVEKHRKYIVALTVILLGDYPGIRAFLPGKGGER